MLAEERLFESCSRAPLQFRDTPLDDACTRYVHSVEGAKNNNK